MTHDELVIWAYENASEVGRLAGFALWDREAARGEMRISEMRERAVEQYLRDVSAALYGRDSYGYPLRHVERQHWPAGFTHPDAVNWPDLPAPGSGRAIERILEKPLDLSGGLRFVDLAVRYEQARPVVDLDGSARYILVPDDLDTYFFFEVKPVIRRLDELLQQCRIYRNARPCKGLAVISPDTRYKRVIEEQGFPFVVPTIGQQALAL